MLMLKLYYNEDTIIQPYTYDWTMRVEDRERYWQELRYGSQTQSYLRRTKNNPVLIGDAGVGKTAIAEGLALNIIGGNVHPFLKDKRVLSLQLGQSPINTGLFLVLLRRICCTFFISESLPIIGSIKFCFARLVKSIEYLSKNSYFGLSSDV
jgi:hypothetical protein